MPEGKAVPEDNGGNLRSLLLRHKKSLITLALFVVYAAAVFWVNYSSLHRLQENSLTQFRLETEKQASAISYFFSERISDISELAESSVVEAFFTNRDLGMSYEYGLGVNVQLIENRFERIAQRKRIGDQALYSALALMDKNGQFIASWGQDEAGKPQDTDCLCATEKEPAGHLPGVERSDLPGGDDCLDSGEQHLCPVWQHADVRRDFAGRPP